MKARILGVALAAMLLVGFTYPEGIDEPREQARYERDVASATRTCEREPVPDFADTTGCVHFVLATGRAQLDARFHHAVEFAQWLRDHPIWNVVYNHYISLSVSYWLVALDYQDLLGSPQWRHVRARTCAEATALAEWAGTGACALAFDAVEMGAR